MESRKVRLRRVAAAPTADDASDEDTVVNVSRSVARELWLSGKLAALFNLPFDREDLFESCVDFCVEEVSKPTIGEGAGSSSTSEPNTKGRGRQRVRRRSLQASEGDVRLGEEAARVLKLLAYGEDSQTCASCASLRNLNASVQSELADSNGALVLLRDELQQARYQIEDLERVKVRAETKLKVERAKTEGAERARRQSQLSTSHLADELVRLRELNSDLTADARFLKEENRQLRAELRTRIPDGPTVTGDANDSSAAFAQRVAAAQNLHDGYFLPTDDIFSPPLQEPSTLPDQHDHLNKQLLSAGLNTSFPSSEPRRVDCDSLEAGDEWND